MDLVPRTGIGPGPAALGAWSLSHWTTRETAPPPPVTDLFIFVTEFLVEEMSRGDFCFLYRKEVERMDLNNDF